MPIVVSCARPWRLLPTCLFAALACLPAGCGENRAPASPSEPSLQATAGRRSLEEQTARLAEARARLEAAQREADQAMKEAMQASLEADAAAEKAKQDERAREQSATTPAGLPGAGGGSAEVVRPTPGPKDHAGASLRAARSRKAAGDLAEKARQAQAKAVRAASAVAEARAAVRDVELGMTDAGGAMPPPQAREGS